MGRQEGLPHLDHRLPRRHASVGAAADMRTRHPAAHEWRAQPGSARVDVSVFVFSDGTFFVALGLSPRCHRCAATAVRFGHKHREDLKLFFFLKKCSSANFVIERLISQSQYSKIRTLSAAVRSGSVISIVATSGGLYYLWRSSAHMKEPNQH